MSLIPASIRGRPADVQVFAEEAVRFVVALWRQIVFESAAYKVSADTGDVMI